MVPEHFDAFAVQRLDPIQTERAQITKARGFVGAVKCAAGAAFSPAGGAVILRTRAHVRVGDAALQADTAVLRALRKDTL
ncbi:MAG: hypothetical protein ACXVRK_10200, partial [Gaiellaceae bacterium]